MPIFWDSSDIFCDTSFSVDHSTPLIFNAWSFHHSAIRKLIILVIIPWLHLTLCPLCGPGESENQFLTIPTSLRRNTWLMYAWSRTRFATVRSKPSIAWITDNLFVLWMWCNGERMDRYEKLSYKKKKEWRKWIKYDKAKSHDHVSCTSLSSLGTVIGTSLFLW